MAIAGGYRGRFAFPVGVGLGTDREGLYLAANYNYLHGFRYYDIDFRLRMDTDSVGLLTDQPVPAATTVHFTCRAPTPGRAWPIDVGVGAVINNWEFGFGANGIGNFIDWTDVGADDVLPCQSAAGQRRSH